MRVTYIELLGERHPLCFSLSAAEALAAKFGSLGEMNKALTSKDPIESVDAIDYVLRIMLKAGRTYLSAKGENLPPSVPCPPSELLHAKEKTTAMSAIYAAIINDSEREVEIEPKNAPATSGE